MHHYINLSQSLSDIFYAMCFVIHCVAPPQKKPKKTCDYIFCNNFNIQQ